MFSSRIVNVANMYLDAIHENKIPAIFFLNLQFRGCVFILFFNFRIVNKNLKRQLAGIITDVNHVYVTGLGI